MKIYMEKQGNRIEIHSSIIINYISMKLYDFDLFLYPVPGTVYEFRELK